MMPAVNCLKTENGPKKWGYEEAVVAADHVKSLLSQTKHPTIGLVCGSGFGAISDKIENAVRIPYSDIPGFPVPSVLGHRSLLVVGTLGNKQVACMQGRTHPYEGLPMEQLVFPIRIMRLLGIETIFLTNAAGAVNPKFSTGDLMLITDHICLPGLVGLSPLRGHNDDRFGPRFPSLTAVYDQQLQKVAHRVADKLQVSHIIQEGVYVMCGGPQFETPAEARFLRAVGGDALGMSTCHEAIVAKHCGMRVFGLSLLTNNIPLHPPADATATTHDEVLEVGRKRQEIATALLAGVIEQMEESRS